jgi:hypothetical protein
MKWSPGYTKPSSSTQLYFNNKGSRISSEYVLTGLHLETLTEPMFKFLQD